MKRKLLLLTALVVSALTGMRAQTDVTSTYITNPSFELGTDGTPASTGKAWVAPYQWTPDGMPTSGTHNFTVLSGSETSNTSPSAFGTTIAPADGDYYYFARHSWQSVLTTSLSQTSKAQLPAGKYYIDIAYKIARNSEAPNGYLQLDVNKDNGSIASVKSIKSAGANNTFFNTSSWSRVGVPFQVDAAGNCDFKITFFFNPDNKNTPQEAIVIDDLRLYDLGSVTASNGLDVSGLVKNTNFNLTTEGWTSTTGASSNKLANNKTGAITGNFYENWNGAPFTGKISQSISSIPNGIYKFTCASFFNQASDYSNHVKVFANEDSENVTNVDPVLYTVYTNVTDGNLELGVNKTSLESESGADWIGIDNISLIYYGSEASIAEVKLANFVSAYKEALASAQSHVDKNMFDEDKSALNTAITDNTLDLNDNNLTEEQLVTATENLNSAAAAAVIAEEKYTTYNTAVSMINGGANVDLTSLIENNGFEQGNMSGWTN